MIRLPMFCLAEITECILALAQFGLGLRFPIQLFHSCDVS